MVIPRGQTHATARTARIVVYLVFRTGLGIDEAAAALVGMMVIAGVTTRGDREAVHESGPPSCRNTVPYPRLLVDPGTDRRPHGT